MSIREQLTKNKTVLILLLAMMLFGFYLRSFHLDFPSIGYHNMKENEYLSQAALQQQEGDYLRRKMHIFGREATPYFEEYPQMPILPWLFQIMWFVFGNEFWAARIILVLFSIATIPLLYVLTKNITKSDYIALTAAFLFSFMPLAVFFGRNIQPETPALFFLLLGMIYYTDYLEHHTKANAMRMGLALAFAAIFKPTFLIGLIPMAAIFSFEKLKETKFRTGFLKHAGWAAVAFSPMPMWNVISSFLNVDQSLTQGTLARVDLFRVFTATYWNQYWPTINAYIADNYTWFYVYLMMLGLGILLLKYSTPIARFLLAYTLAIIPYGMILADYLKAHSYYQFPFLPLVCMACAFAIYTIGMLLKQLTNIRYIQFAALLILLIPISDVQAHTDAQYNTIFYGLDATADFLKANAGPTDRLWMSGHAQSFGVCYNSGMWCGPPWWDDLNKTIRYEDERNFRWLFVHGAQGLMELRATEVCGNKAFDEDGNVATPCPTDEFESRQQIWEYFENNYRIRLIGLGPQQNNGQPIPTVYLFEKGGNFSLSELNAIPYRQEQKTYDVKGGQAQMLVLTT